MSLFDTLPVVLVSAANEAAAAALISELIDDDITDEYDVEKQCADRVWRLVNKYYTANVRVHPLVDDRQLDVDPDNIDAHIIHITAEESSADSTSAAEARVSRSGGAWRRSAVRLLLCDAPSEAAALRAWAARQRADLVPLREAAPADIEERGEWREAAPADLEERGLWRSAAPDDLEERGSWRSAALGSLEEHGVRRARAALHAHVWRGLTRTDRRAAPPLADRYGGSSSGSDAEDGERRAVEQAEAFAAALDALGGALESRRAPEDALRRRRAEHVVRAFCRALALPLEPLEPLDDD